MFTQPDAIMRISFRMAQNEYHIVSFGKNENICLPKTTLYCELNFRWCNMNTILSPLERLRTSVHPLQISFQMAQQEHHMDGFVENVNMPSHKMRL